MEKILILPGDGIGPEVMTEVRRVIEWFGTHRNFDATCETDLVGGCAYDAHGTAISDATMAKACAADIVLLGAVGGAKWNNVPYAARPEAGLLRLRKDMELFANLRPAICFAALADASSLKRDIVEGLDIMIVRELTGGIYFGEPRGITSLSDGGRRGVNTQIYESYEITRVGRVAAELARKRGNHVTSVEKRNVMESGMLWHEEISAMMLDEYADVSLSHMLADNCAMQLVRAPKQFDVIVTDNLFGDILSDIAAMLTGSLGMLPSASLGAPRKDARNHTGRARALYEPVHGSAPDIAGKGLANPIASILSFAMALRYSFERIADADLLERSIDNVLEDGYRTADIMQERMTLLSTEAMGTAIIDALAQLNS